MATDGLGIEANQRSGWLVPTAPSPMAPAALARDQRSFLDALGRHGVVSAPGVKPGAGDEDEARRAAEQFVSTTFILPILKEIRAQNRAAPPFGPTQAERSLGPMMDAQLADRMVRSSRFGIVDRVAADLRAAQERAEALARRNAGDEPAADAATAWGGPGGLARGLRVR